jgi:PAS domain S-box-containing protein
MIAVGCLSVLAAARLALHREPAGSLGSLIELGGLLLLVALPWAWMLLRPERGGLRGDIAPVAIADWLALAPRVTGYGVTISDASRRLIWVNDSFTRMTGYTAAEVMGAKTSDLLYFERTDAEMITRVRGAFAENRGARFECLVRSKSGREWWLDTDAQPLFDDRGTLRGWVCIQADVTDEVLKREATRRDQNRILTMIQGGSIGTWDRRTGP